jgi:sarcosine oxidase subunit gamma
MGSTFHSLVDISHRNTAFDVSGPAAETLLASGVLLDLNVASFPVGMATRTIFSKAEIILWRNDASTFNLSVWRSFVPFVWGLLHEASEEL